MLGLVGGILKLAFNLIVIIYVLMGKLIKLMCKPFKLLWDKIRDLIGMDMLIPYRINDKFSAFNGLLPFCLFIIALIFSVVMVLVGIADAESGGDIVQELIYNTTIGFIIGMIENGQEVTPAAFAAIAFSGALLPLCLKAHKSDINDVPFYVHIPCYLVYLVFSASLAMMLTGIFQAIGDWGFQAIVTLFNEGNNEFFPILGKILALIPLCYFALLIGLVAVKNFAETFVFGTLGMVVVLIVSVLMMLLVPEDMEALKNTVFTITMVALLVGLDALQIKAVERFEQYIEEESY